MQMPGTLKDFVARALPRWHRAASVSDHEGHGLDVRAAAFDSAACPMIICDREGRIVRVNAAFSGLTGYAPEDVVGETPRILKSGQQPAAFYDGLWQTILAGQPWRGRLVNRKKNGEIYDVEQAISPVHGPDGRITHFLAIHEDIHERLEHERRLLHDAMFDPVTELPNWNLLRRRIVDATARARRSSRALAVMSLSFPGPVDTPRLLAVARSVRSCLREADLIASHEGGLLAVIEELERPQLASWPAERLSAQLRAHRVHAGIAVYPGDDASPEVLVQHAQAAGRYAQGQGGFRYFHPKM